MNNYFKGDMSMLKQVKDTHQQQDLPCEEDKMNPHPIDEDENYIGSNKLKDKMAIITGGDSGIGRAVAIAFAKEGADLVISYLSEHDDANQTKARIEELGRRCVLIPGDISDFGHCREIVKIAIDEFGRIDILVNHAGEQYETKGLDNITEESISRIFQVNVFAVFFLTQAVLPHLKPGASIINTSSVVAYKGNPTLVDYSATRGAIVTFTRSLANLLAEKGIRVNSVAPGPIWTPLIPASFSPEKLESFGQDTPLKRPGQPFELAPTYVYLASHIMSSYVTGQVLHVNGGLPVAS